MSAVNCLARSWNFTNRYTWHFQRMVFEGNLHYWLLWSFYSETIWVSCYSCNIITRSTTILRYWQPLLQLDVPFISKAWGDRAWDWHITQHSGFLHHLLYGDLVLADRGFNIHDELAVRGASLEVPLSIKEKKKSREDVKWTGNLAHVRIHFERVIGPIKN